MYYPRKARTLIRRYRTSCPYDIASSLRIHVRFEDLPHHVRGFYTKMLRRRFIVINSSLPDEWKRFVCAHEIAHSCLHPGLGYYFIEEHTLLVPGKYEREANRYAVDMLTDGEVIRESEPLESYYSRCNIPKDIIGKI